MARKFLNGLDNASQRLVHVADGTSADDAATYGQVLQMMNNKAWKDPVRAASTANVTIASALINASSMDGVTLATGDAVLLKNQTTASENGVYLVVASGAATRRTNEDASSEVVGGMTVYVNEGTANGDTQWTLTTNNPIVLGTTSLTFTQSGATTPDTAGNGLQKSGTAFSVKLPASSGLVADGTGTYLDTAIAVRKFSQLIGDGSTTAIAVTHGLGTKDVEVALRDASTDAEVDTDVVRTSTTVITLTFAVAPASNAYRVTVQG